MAIPMGKCPRCGKYVATLTDGDKVWYKAHKNKEGKPCR